MNDEQESLRYIREYMFAKAGIVIEADKDYLITSRLNPVMKLWNFEDLKVLVQLLKSSEDLKLSAEVINALTTHETYFFRDKTPFALMENELFPRLLERNKDSKKIKIWSAACSTGQEIYSTAIVLSEIAARHAGWEFVFLGTDISQNVLLKARQGVYTDLEIERGLEARYKDKYFTRTDSGLWKINFDHNFKFEFQEFNLTKFSKKIDDFDLILLRNVLIYFDLKSKIDILNKVHENLKNEGFLLLGTAETTLSLSNKFKRNPAQGTAYFIKS